MPFAIEGAAESIAGFGGGKMGSLSAHSREALCFKTILDPNIVSSQEGKFSCP